MIRIITDASSDLSHERCKKLGIDLLPLAVHFEDESFKAGIDLDHATFYQKLSTSKTLPTTSQITPGEFEQIFTEYLEQGDDIVGLFISSKMSGTYLNAIKAKEAIGADNIYLVDTFTVTFALALIVEEAAKLRDSGLLTAAQLAEKIKELVPRVHLLAVVQDLNYLKMGGRLSTTSAFFAAILGICPVITIKDGLVEAIGKARGRKAAFGVIEKEIAQTGISSDYALTLGHSDAPELLEEFKMHFRDTLKKRNVYTCDIGSIVGTHVGPNACGIAYIKK